ncbi:hypothetical protein KCU67_g71, partial [Aureobasidium melanogenum]
MDYLISLASPRSKNPPCDEVRTSFRFPSWPMLLRKAAVQHSGAASWKQKDSDQPNRLHVPSILTPSLGDEFLLEQRIENDSCNHFDSIPSNLRPSCEAASLGDTHRLSQRLHNDGAIMHNILQYTLLYNDVKPRDCGAKMRLLALALKPGGVKAWTGKRYPRITRYHSHAAELQELPAYLPAFNTPLPWTHAFSTMADPLSITAGIIAVGGAAHIAAKGAHMFFHIAHDADSLAEDAKFFATHISRSSQITNAHRTGQEPNAAQAKRTSETPHAAAGQRVCFGFGRNQKGRSCAYGLDSRCSERRRHGIVRKASTTSTTRTLKARFWIWEIQRSQVEGHHTDYDRLAVSGVHQSRESRRETIVICCSRKALVHKLEPLIRTALRPSKR